MENWGSTITGGMIIALQIPPCNMTVAFHVLVVIKSASDLVANMTDPQSIHSGSSDALFKCRST
jgi:hypothetical protein